VNITIYAAPHMPLTQMQSGFCWRLWFAIRFI
jgi:hypothetical protein